MSQPSDILGKLDGAQAFVHTRSRLVPSLGIVAGGGLGMLAGIVEDAVRIPYAAIPHALAPTPPAPARRGWP